MAHNDQNGTPTPPQNGAGKHAAASSPGSDGGTNQGQPRRDRISTTFPATPPEIASTVKPSNFVPAPQLSPTPPPTGRPHYREKRFNIATLVVCIMACLLVGSTLFITLFPWPCTVTVNGRSIDTNVHTTLEGLVEQGAADPAPGDFLAIDGSLLGENAGWPFTATVNGVAEPNLQRAVVEGDVIEITDGADRTEDFTEETSTVYPPVAIDGVGAVHRFAKTGVTGQSVRRVGSTSGIVQQEVTDPGTTETLERLNVDTGDDKVLALTFDDGPIGTTPELLDVLKQYGVKATFFTIGDQIFDKTDFSEVVKRAADEGHQICTHSYDHASGSGRGVDMTRMSADEQIAEVQKGQDAITQATGKEASKIFRSPGGNYHDEIIWTLQPYVTGEIGWNVDTEDWRRPGAEAIAQRLLSVKPGDVVLMHDGGGDRSQTIEALKIALPQLVEEGYKFVTIDQLIAYDDVEALAKDLQDAAAA